MRKLRIKNWWKNSEAAFWIAWILFAVLAVLLIFSSAVPAGEEYPMPRTELCGHDTSADKIVLERIKYFDNRENPLIEITVFGSSPHPRSASYMIFSAWHPEGVFSVAKFKGEPNVVFVLGSCSEIPAAEFAAAEVKYVERIEHETIIPYEP